MGGVLKLVEFSAMAVGVGTSIANQAYQAQIRKIISDHQHEFDLLAFCQNFLDKISQQGQLLFQIQAGSTSAELNWNSIAEAINGKRDIMKKLSDNYKAVAAKADLHKFGWDKIMLGIVLPPVLFGVFEGYNAYRMNKLKALSEQQFIDRNNMSIQQQVNSQKGTYKDFMSDAPESMKESLLNNRKSESASFSDDNVKIQEKSTSVSIETAVKPETKTLKDNAKVSEGKFSIAMRVLNIALMIYMDVKIIQSNIAIKKDLDALKKYFKNSGKFDQIKKDTIDIMKLFSIDVFNLVAASRALVIDFQQIIYMSSILDNEHKQSLINLSLEFDPEKLNMGFDFFKATRSVLQEMNAIQPKSSKQYTSSLETVRALLKPLDSDWGIFDRFSNFASDISKLLANIGYAITDYNKYSESFTTMIQLTEGLIQQRNKNLATMNIDTSNVADAFKTVIKSFDSMTLSSDENNYKIILGSKMYGKSTFNLSIDDKTRIAQMISMFTDNFYSDYDATSPKATDGKTVYGIQLSSFDSGYTNSQLMDMITRRTSTTNLIPVTIPDAQEEKKFEEEFIAAGMSLKPELFTDKTTLLKNVQFRYQKFYIVKDKFVLNELANNIVKEVKYDALSYNEGIMVQLTQFSPIKLYGVERNMETNVFEVVSYSV